MTEKQLYDAIEVEKVLRTLEKNFMGVSPRGKEQANVVAFVRKHISAIPKVTPENLQLLTYNEDVEYQSIDSFACHNCGTWIENWNKVEEDSGGCRQNAGWYVPKRCPECGAKIISHKSCAFCQVALARWNLLQQIGKEVNDRPGGFLLDLGGTRVTENPAGHRVSHWMPLPELSKGADEE